MPASGKLVDIDFPLSNWNCCPVIPPSLREVGNQDDHVACQKFCAETAHRVGYTFVKVAFRVVVLGVGVCILVLFLVHYDDIVVGLTNNLIKVLRRCDLKDSAGAWKLSGGSGLVSGKLEELQQGTSSN